MEQLEHVRHDFWPIEIDQVGNLREAMETIGDIESPEIGNDDGGGSGGGGSAWCGPFQVPQLLT